MEASLSITRVRSFFFCSQGGGVDHSLLLWVSNISACLMIRYIPPPMSKKKKRFHTRDRKRGFHRPQTQNSSALLLFFAQESRWWCRWTRSWTQAMELLHKREVSHTHASAVRPSLFAGDVFALLCCRPTCEPRNCFFLRDFAIDLRYFETSIICARQGWACRRVRS